MTDRELKLAIAADALGMAALEMSNLLRGNAANEDEPTPKRKSSVGAVVYRFDVVPYGKMKGEQFTALTTDELLWWEERFEAEAKWKKNTQRQLDCVRAILKERRAAQATERAEDDAD